MHHEHQQRQGHGGGRILLPSHHRHHQCGSLHPHRPKSGGSPPGHHRIEHQHRDEGHSAAAAVTAQHHQHPHQKGDVEPGHHRGVGHTRPIHVGVQPVIQQALVSQGHRNGQRGSGLVKGHLDALFHPLGRPGGPAGNGQNSGALHRGCLVTGPQQKHPLGRIIGHFFPIGERGILHLSLHLDMVPQLYRLPAHRRIEKQVRPGIQAQSEGIASGLRYLGLSNHRARDGLHPLAVHGRDAHQKIVHTKPAQSGPAAQHHSRSPAAHLPEQIAPLSVCGHLHPVLSILGLGQLPEYENRKGGDRQPQNRDVPHQQQTHDSKAPCKPGQLAHVRHLHSLSFPILTGAPLQVNRSPGCPGCGNLI